MGSSWTTAALNGIPPFTEQFHPSCHCAIWQSSITTCFSQSLKTCLCTMTSCNFNFIQEHWSCFVNMLLGRLNWASTLQDDAQSNSNTTITSHCTTSTELLLSGRDDSSVTRRTSFKLQKCCHYFVSNPCIYSLGLTKKHKTCFYKCQNWIATLDYNIGQNMSGVSKTIPVPLHLQHNWAPLPFICGYIHVYERWPLCYALVVFLGKWV